MLSKGQAEALCLLSHKDHFTDQWTPGVLGMKQTQYLTVLWVWRGFTDRLWDDFWKALSCARKVKTEWIRGVKVRTESPGG